MTENNAMWWFVLFLLVLGVMWYSQRGSMIGEPLREPPPTSTSFVQEAPRAEIPQQKPSLEETTPQEPQRPPGISKYEGKISLYASRVTETDPKEEYLEIWSQTSNKEPITITGWSVTGSSRLDITIGEGVSLLFPSPTLSSSLPVTLNPGDMAVIITGKSPIGLSFKINKCTGYLAQFQSFKPALPLNCPRPENEPEAETLPDECQDYLGRLNRCHAPLAIPAEIAARGCGSYTENNINYGGCFKNHRNDADFYKNEWRIYLGRDEELWKNRRETITLKDEEGKVVSRVSY